MMCLIVVGAMHPRHQLPSALLPWGYYAAALLLAMPPTRAMPRISNGWCNQKTQTDKNTQHPLPPSPCSPAVEGMRERRPPHRTKNCPARGRPGQASSRGCVGKDGDGDHPNISSPGEEVSLGWRSNLAIWHPPNNKQPRGLRTGHSPATPPCFSGSHLDVSTTRITNRAEPYEHNRAEPNRTELNRTRKNHQRSPCTHVHERPEGDHM